MNYEAVQMANLLSKLEDKFNLNVDKVHMLCMMVGRWNSSGEVKITDVLKSFTRTSRATTHRAIKELVSDKLIKEVKSPDDRRTKYLVPGAKFDRYIRTIGEML